MLDVPTLRLAFGVVTLTVLVLTYIGPYRDGHTTYARWWTGALGLYLGSTLLYLLDGTALQVAANPLGNAAGVLGSAFVWAGARSLRRRDLPLWQLGLVPLIALVDGFLHDPAHNVWTGGATFLGGMTLLLALTAVELCAHGRSRRRTRRSDRGYDVALGAMGASAALVSVFYLGRTVCFIATGPHSRVFDTFFGSSPTTLVLMVMMVVVTFSMATLSHSYATLELRARATRDPLTDVLNRSEFLTLAERLRTGAASSADPALLIADLDGFKALNDSYGHAAGDHALIEFAETCRRSVGPEDLIGRLGGDEFAVVLSDGRRAEALTRTISKRYRARRAGLPGATVSFGIAPLDRRTGVKETLMRADVALYRAKAAGRNRAIRYDETG